MPIIDITKPIHERMAIYPENPEVEFEEVKQGHTRIVLGSHTGTHIDAPSHIEEGKAGTGVYDLEAMNGECVVTTPQSASPSKGSKRVLLKTRNSGGDIDTFDPDFEAIDEEMAQQLVDAGVKLVGIDAPSIKKKGVKDNTHKILLDAGVVILEGLWLKNVEPGEYELLCLPLKVDFDGAPVRAVLRN